MYHLSVSGNVSPRVSASVSGNVLPSVSASVLGNVSPSVLPSVLGNVLPSVLGNASEYEPERRRSGTRIFQVYRDSIPRR